MTILSPKCFDGKETSGMGPWRGETRAGATGRGPEARRKAGLWIAAAVVLLTILFGCKKSPPPENERAQASQAASAGGAPSTLTPPGSPAPTGSLADRLKAVESGEADKVHLVLPNWKPFPKDATPIAIPLRAGFGAVAVDPSRIKDLPGDIPIVATVEDITPTQLHVHHHNDPIADKRRTMSEHQDSSGLPEQKQAEVDHRESECDITVDRVDLAKSHGMRDYVCKDKVEHYPGTEPFGVSTEVLTELRAGQPVDFHFVPDSDMTASMSAMGTLMGSASELPPVTPYANVPMFECTLKRVEPYDLAFPVMLNDQPVELPALHAMCPFPDGREGHLYLLDEPDNPLKLWGNMGVLPETLQVIRIVLPPAPRPVAAAPATSPMESALAANQPVEIYGIYFDFDSDRIKAESAGVIKEIAGILQRNPGWKLTVSGHTDNIGEDNFNLGLSQRRAAAVKNALVGQYKIAPERLATAGYGASQPIADNATIEGRARNRRVELKRE